MPEKQLDKAGHIADNIKKIGGVVIPVLIAVISCVSAWYKILENEKQIILLEQRSDKRYHRAQEWKIDLEKEGRRLLDEVDHLENQIIYIKGKEGY